MKVNDKIINTNKNSRSIMEANTLNSLFSLAETLSVPGLLIVIVWWLEKRFTKVEDKHEEEMKRIKEEHINILKAIKEDHDSSLAAQREAHLHEKTEFFKSLDITLRELVKEIQISNEARSKIVFDMNQISKYQDEVRKTMDHFSSEQELIKTTLLHNSEVLSVLIKCDLNGEAGGGFKKGIIKPVER